MPRRSKQRSRARGVSKRRSPVVSDISTWDHVRLKRELCSRPERVLAFFKECQVSSLTELDVFLEILRENPSRAAIIALAAAGMGILIGDEDEGIDDVLATMKPGEV
jgi:hypothetical protein